MLLTMSALKQKDLNSIDLISNLEEQNELSNSEIKRLERKIRRRTIGAGIVVGATIILTSL